MCTLLSAPGPHLVQTPVYCYSFYEFICVPSLLYLRGLVSLVFSIPSGSYILSASSSAEFPEPMGEEFDRDIPFRTERSEVSHSLHIVWLWVYVFDPIC